MRSTHKEKRRQIVLPFLLSIFVCLSLLAITFYITERNHRNDLEKEHQSLLRGASNVKSKFLNILYNNITAAHSLALIHIEFDLDEKFDRIAKAIIDKSKYVEAIQITENGIIKKVYPFKDYEKTIGVNTWADSARKKEEQIAFESMDIYFAGPRQLRMGGVGILGKAPSVSKNGTKGLIVVLTKLPTIIHALEPSDGLENRFSYILRKNIKGDTSSFLLSKIGPDINEEKISVDIPYGNWILDVAYHKNYQHPPYPFTILILGFLLSVTAAFLIYRTVRQPYKLQEIISVRTHEVKERVKELSTIYNLNKILQDENKDIDELFKKIVAIIPPGWQYPEVCTARIIFDKKEYTSIHFKDSEFRQMAEFKTIDGREGSIEVFYTDARPLDVEGPFLKEERDLINALAETLEIYFNKLIHEQEQIESEMKFRNLVEKSLVGVYIAQEGKFAYVNPRFEEILEYGTEEMIGMDYTDIIYSEDMPIAREKVRLREEKKEASVNYEIRCVTKTDRIIWVELLGSITTLNGKPALIGTLMDITGRIESTEELKRRESELTAFFNNIEGAAALLDEKKKYVIYNDRFSYDHHLLTDQLPKKGMEVYDLFPEQIKKERLELIDKVIRDGKKETVEVNYLSEGKRVAYRTSFNPVITNGKVTGVTTYSLDLTNIKEAEFEILRLNRLYQFISEINESILKSESQEEIFTKACNIAVNIGKFRMAWIGTYDEEKDLIEPVASSGFENGFFENLPKEAFIVATSAIPAARAIRTKAYFYYNDIENSSELSEKTKNEMLKRGYRSGLSFPFFVNSKIVGAFVLLMSEPFFFNEEEIKLLKDVTDNITFGLDKLRIRELQEKAEIASKEAEMKFRNLVEKSPVGVYIFKKNAFAYVNPRMAIKSGYMEEELVNIPLEKLIHEHDLPVVHEKIAQRLNDEIDEIRCEIQIITKDGNTIWVELFGTATVYEGESAIIGTMVNITEKKLLSDEREKVINDLLQRNRDLEQFSYIVSHNIRGPLATILGLGNLLNDGVTQKEKETVLIGMREHASKLDDVVKDLNAILNVKKDLLQSKVNVNLNQLVQNVLIDVDGLVKSSNASVTYDFKAIDSIDSIKGYVHSIFLNLISNSIKYRMAGKDPLIRIHSEQVNDKVRIYFKDNGAGIDLKKYGNQVFGLYKRFNLSVEGKGMGLYMVRTQVGAMNGTIELESEPGKGSLFTITLPLT
jgi:PAS domain S-box-containing protein